MSLKGGKSYVVMNFIWSHSDCSSEYFQLPDLHRGHQHMSPKGLHAPRRESLSCPGQFTCMLMWTRTDMNNHGVVSSR